uniref:Small ribosomal subunit protein uS17c n=1 Tax=Ananas comosus var. bracteatus TaxID=296719 RepID=A0A6V7QVF8_ANACO
MLLTSPFLHPPSSSSSLTCSTFLHGPLPLPANFKTLTLAPSPPLPPPVVRAMKKLQGRVVCATNDKTVAVEVVRLAPHPKYKRRVRKKKKYQAHDPENLFKVGDFVQLEKSRPISKTKTFLAVPSPPGTPPSPSTPSPPPSSTFPLQSQQQPTAPQE